MTFGGKSVAQRSVAAKFNQLEPMSTHINDETVATSRRCRNNIRCGGSGKTVAIATKAERERMEKEEEGTSDPPLTVSRSVGRLARQVVEMNIVRGRGAQRKNVVERKSGGRVCRA